MATVNALVYQHHQKADGTFNVKIRVYHKGEKRFIDTAHFVTKRQLNSDFQIKDKFLIKILEETLSEYRKTISELGLRLEYFSAEDLRDFLRDKDADIDFIAFYEKFIEQLQIDGRASAGLITEPLKII